MGFGSYDESEQERQQVDSADDGATVNVHENAYEGELTTETGSTDDLLGQLQEIKANDED